MLEGLKAAMINPAKYRNVYTSPLYKPDQVEIARMELNKDLESLNCSDCPFHYAEHGGYQCRHVDKDDRLPSWADGANMCLRYAKERLGQSGWIMPSGDPFVITKEAAQAIAAALDDLE